MPLNGSGTYTPPAPEFPAISNTLIKASDFNAIINDVAAALSQAIFRDGQVAFIADQSMGGFKLRDLSNALLAQDATPYKQMTDYVAAQIAISPSPGVILTSITALRALSYSTNTKAFVLGYYSSGDGGGGAYYYDSTDTTSADNGGTIIVATDGGRWKLTGQQSVSVEQFGAIADGDGVGGGTDNSTALQNAFTARITAGKAGVVRMQSGTYRCDTGVTVDASVVRIEADGTLLDFTNIASNSTALTVSGGTLGYAGNPFFNAYSVIQGLKIYGGTWGGSGTTKGVRFYDNAQNSGAHSGMRDCLIYGFHSGISIEENNYLLSFDHVEVAGCGTCVTEPTASNAGERIVFSHCAFYNSQNGLVLQNSIASTFLNHCSIDGMSDIYFLIECGHLSVTDCHIEGNFAGDSPNARMFWNSATQSPSYSYVTWSGNHVLVKDAGVTPRANPVFDFLGAINFTMVGGYVYANEGATVAAPVFSGNGSGSVTVIGTFVDYGSNTLNNITGPAYHFDLANNLNSARNLGSVAAPALEATTSGIKSNNGVFFNNTNSVTLAALSTQYSLGVGTASGLLVCRDGTSGGTAVFACDPSSGTVSIQNSIAGLAVAYNAGQLSLQVTSGATNRQVRWALLKTQD